GDYQGSGFDRGHMAPAGDMHNQESMAQSFSLANIVPQNAQHNRGAWSKIEADTRKYVSRAQGDVYISLVQYMRSAQKPLVSARSPFQSTCSKLSMMRQLKRRGCIG